MATHSTEMAVEVRDLGEAAIHSRLQVSMQLPTLLPPGTKAVATVKGMGKVGLRMCPRVTIGVSRDEATNREVPVARIVRAVAKTVARANRASVITGATMVTTARVTAAKVAEVAPRGVRAARTLHPASRILPSTAGCFRFQVWVGVGGNS